MSVRTPDDHDPWDLWNETLWSAGLVGSVALVVAFIAMLFRP